MDRPLGLRTAATWLTLVLAAAAVAPGGRSAAAELEAEAEAPVGAASVATTAERLKAADEALGRARALADAGRGADASAVVGAAYRAAVRPLERALGPIDPGAWPGVGAAWRAAAAAAGSGRTGPALGARLDGARSGLWDAAWGAEAAGGRKSAAATAALQVVVREGFAAVAVLALLAATAAGAGVSRRTVDLGAAAGLALGVGLSPLFGMGADESAGAAVAACGFGAAALLFHAAAGLVAWSPDPAAGAGTLGPGLFGLVSVFAAGRAGAGFARSVRVLLGVQASAAGPVAVAAGSVTGLVMLAGLALLVRRLAAGRSAPALARAAGAAGFALAAALAGQGTWALQSADLLAVTDLPAVGRGATWLGVYPTAQGVEVQAVVAAGAVLAAARARGRRATARVEPAGVTA